MEFIQLEEMKLRTRKQLSQEIFGKELKTKLNKNRAEIGDAVNQRYVEKLLQKISKELTHC